MAAVNLCYENHLPFTAGYSLNLYNAESLAIMLRNGMKRWCFPVELSQSWIQEIKESAEPSGIWPKFEKRFLLTAICRSLILRDALLHAASAEKKPIAK